MGKDSSKDESLFKYLMRKSKNPICIFLIFLFYIANDNLKFIDSKELVFGICIILICMVLLKDTIYKCFDRWCKRDETIEKEKTKRKLKGTTKNSDDDSGSTGGIDCKLYDIKRRNTK